MEDIPTASFACEDVVTEHQRLDGLGVRFTEAGGDRANDAMLSDVVATDP